MNGAIVHRGPDDEGLWATDGFAFAMRRLSIIDLAGGHQPIWSDDGVGIIFNGEIYNYRALRGELEASGTVFATHSDTEVVLHLYRRDGLAMVERLEGMFAICIYDGRQCRLHLIRDRFGVKPLYYADIDATFYFASEIKAIVAALPQRPGLNLQAVHDYLTLRYVPEPDTIWRGIHKLPPGHRLSYRLDTCERRVERYWQFDFAAQEFDPVRDYAAEFSDLFLAAVEKRLVAAALPVGVLLSGGLDSSAVSAAAVELGHRDFHTFSVAFEDGGSFDETPFAREAAAHIGSQHHEVLVSRDTFVDFLPDFVRISDEPLADLAGIPLHFVCRLARNDVKVVLSGEGSDEVLAGYNFDRLASFLHRLTLAERFTPPGSRGLLSMLPIGGEFGTWLRLWAKHGAGKMFGARPYHMTMHWDEAEKASLWRETAPFRSTVDALRERYAGIGGRQPIDQIQQIYCGDWLVEDLLMKADKMSMATSLEVREPFLDHRLAEWAARLPIALRVGDALRGFESKHILREFCRKRLPVSILDRPKQGFPVPAYAWLKDSLRDWADKLLLDPKSRVAEFFRVESIRPVLASAQEGNTGAAHKVWVLIVFEQWLRVWA